MWPWVAAQHSLSTLHAGLHAHYMPFSIVAVYRWHWLRWLWLNFLWHASCVLTVPQQHHLSWLLYAAAGCSCHAGHWIINLRCCLYALPHTLNHPQPACLIQPRQHPAISYAVRSWCLDCLCLFSFGLCSVLALLSARALGELPQAGGLLLHGSCGACSLLSILAFLTVAAVLILQYAYANVSVQTALNTLLSNNPFTPAVPWAPPLTSLSPAILSGVQLRLFAQDGMACDSLVAGTGVSGSPSGWTVSPPVACGDGRTLLVLSCPTCSFSATSYLKFYLPYTCQSFYLEAIAVDAQGVINSVVFPPVSSVATSTALISSVTWTVEVLGTILKDTIKATVTQGYQLSVSAAATTPLAVGTSIIPSKALVSVTINLPLQTYYSSILLQPQQSLVSLLSSIVGLLGIIGLFRVLFLLSDLTLNHVAQTSKRRLSTAPLANVAQDATVIQTNPLRRGAPAPLQVAPTETLPGEVVDSPWKRHEDGTDVWYVNKETGESSWTLP